jgi:DNA replication protein DnaC
MTNESKCVLSGVCKLAGDQAHCHNRCASYVSLHGASGTGGRIASANIPSDYALLSLRNSPVRSAQPSEYKALDAYVNTFKRAFEADSDAIKSVYIYSSTAGNGKTTTACALLNEWIMRNYIGAVRKGDQPIQQSGYFLEVNALQQLHKRMFSPGSQAKKDEIGDEFNRRMDRAKSAPYLVVDDLAVRKYSESFMAEIYDLTNYRTSNVLPTVYTTNKTLEQLTELFLIEDPEGKVVNRIKDRCVIMEFTGGSKRGMRK